MSVRALCRAAVGISLHRYNPKNQVGGYFLCGEKYLTLPSNPSPSNPNQQDYITKKEFVTNLTWSNQPPKAGFTLMENNFFYLLTLKLTGVDLWPLIKVIECDLNLTCWWLKKADFFIKWQMSGSIFKFQNLTSPVCVLKKGGFSTKCQNLMISIWICQIKKFKIR